MEDLIKALQILLKYGNPDSPTICEHEVMYIAGVDASEVSKEDIKELERLGFKAYYDDQFQSYRFGSA